MMVAEGKGREAASDSEMMPRRTRSVAVAGEICPITVMLRWRPWRYTAHGRLANMVVTTDMN